MEQIVKSVVGLLGTTSSKELVIFIVSMLPILELRGGILAAGMLNVDMVRAFFICFFGTILPVPFILLFIRQILDWMRNTRFVKLVRRIEAKAEEKSKSVEKYKTFGLYIFVAVPLPGTGAWTGSLIAALLGMRFRDAILSVFAGTLTADIIMCIVSYGLLGQLW
ncbi:COG2426 family protein [Caproiciproducens galactitolivorans]|uniref:Small multi-drug export protein n=1 Tax=Caproiciproducens galactitolivorans TaxID=642589 RepID=A0ABT4BT50_9FIRM|nr:small multi-drug export protein [Caproiciproducens galactitolivorans]MCY1714081.1 small multi-drug export protein [Caproiciproducens galactitolivorans]